jgi:hypothetical protein
MQLFPRLSEKIERWAFNGVFGRNFEHIFSLQMWCFGCDVRREAGNLLLAYGFTRERPEAPITGSSHYSIVIDTEHTLHLWGFAIVVQGAEASLCLKRYERTPLLASRINISPKSWRPQDLPRFSRPRTSAERANAQRLLKVLTEHLERYELFAESHATKDYRRACMQQQRFYKKLNAISLESAWRQINRGLSLTH